MESIGREHEKNLLRDQLKKDSSRFIAVYGRRRVGKTLLINETYKKELIFECTGLQGISKHQQLENFWIRLQKKYRSPHLQPKTWLQAFDHLGDYINTLPNKRQKKVIFLDEIPWFDTSRAGFMPAFSNFWNSFCAKREDIILVICGSAASWIINKVVNSRGGLHNRLHLTIRLEPFDLRETKEFLKSKKINLVDKDIAQLYMSIGGIPFYLNEVQQGKSVSQILNDLFFKKDAILKNEHKQLYAALFKNHERHLSIISALSKKNKGLTRKAIVKATSLSSGGGLTQTLEELIECGFIAKSQDYDKKNEDALYRIIDEYTIFHLKFIEGRKQIGNGIAILNSQPYKIWTGFAFENLCFKHIDRIAHILGISGIEYRAYTFLDKGTSESDGSQIDIIIDRSDNAINIIEAKFYNGIFNMTKKEAENIRKRLNSFQRKTKTKKSIFTTLISAMGSNKNGHYLSTITNEITLKDFF